MRISNYLFNSFAARSQESTIAQKMTTRLTLKQIESKFRELDEQEGRTNQYYDKKKVLATSNGTFIFIGDIKCHKEPE